MSESWIKFKRKQNFAPFLDLEDIVEHISKKVNESNEKNIAGSMFFIS